MERHAGGVRESRIYREMFVAAADQGTLARLKVGRCGDDLWQTSPSKPDAGDADGGDTLLAGVDAILAGVAEEGGQTMTLSPWSLGGGAGGEGGDAGGGPGGQR